MDDQKRRDAGMNVRRKVLGNAWVDKSVANRNAFNTDFQDLIIDHRASLPHTARTWLAGLKQVD
uniref:Gamma-carboxymuconolactone decarboxylase n=1 Tax=Bradyrhizobium japonicum TaxID=375 RepID=O31387_BRAJP|nr:gamma-carboxymuconolactone decarboxylase [Bradyrhizobium japonicum]